MRKRRTKFLIATCLLGFAAGSLSSLGCGNSGGAAGASGTAGGGGGSGGGGSGGGESGGGGSTGFGGQAGASASGGGGPGGTTSSGGATGLGGTPTGTGGSQTGGVQGTGGATTGSGGSTTTVTSALVTSTNGTWTTTAMWTETSSATADVTVDDASTAQTWEGFGGAFHEMGWNQLSTKALQDEALGLLFGADGAKLAMARIPIGASDYALERYTLDDTGTDVIPDATESNRPPADITLSTFSIERDKQTLIPYVRAALAINPNLRLWAVPWTPPVWMKTGYQKLGPDGRTAAVKASYFDGGTMKTDAATLTAYAGYLVKFIQAYKTQGITVDTIAPQFEPTFAQTYPSCVWDKTTYTNFVGRHLGPALAAASLSTKIMLGGLANEPADSAIITAVMAESTAMPFVAAIGVQWGVLDKVVQTPLTYGVPVWATEHKCGNYPFIASGRPATATTPELAPYAEPPPNGQPYAVETWWYIRDAITKAKVTAYNVPHMVLDTVGKGNDTSREWAQDSLLTVSGGKITKTQAYYVVRHFSRFVDPGATVVRTSGGDAVAFKNPDGSLVAVVYSAAAKTNYVVAMGGKKLQFSVPASGWATVKYKP
jgi:glucosylceramidase